MDHLPDEPEGLVFDDWYRREFPRVRQAMTLATGDPGLGEEAAAEAFAMAVVHWHRVRRMESPAGWVHATALNQVRRSWRRAALERRHTARLRLGEEPPPELPDTTLWRAVAELSPRARTAVALRYVADLTEAEVARAMDVTRGTVATTLSRARQQLAAHLQTLGEGHVR
ncbi:RNA polymerase sigma factor [Kineococcus sp. DHX-1]|uniref:RNA polymerase sigma factor n=1 Tax=Kineococcus sp. DHX-1 TaxID=3349638 RepID=UPI0036D3E72B